MKKHFLLLLMALLPMAGWALTLDGSKFQATNINYGTALPDDQVSAIGYTENTHYTIDGISFYKLEGESYVAIAVANAATTSTGKYYRKVVGAGDYVGQEVYVDFWINGIGIATATIADFAAETYTGSQITPSTTGKLYVATGVADNPATTDVDESKRYLVENTDYAVSYGANTNAGDAAGTIKFTGINNYSGEVTKTFKISKKAFTEANIEITVASGTFVYNGDPQAPAVTVKDKATNQELAATDYTIKYDNNATAPSGAKDGIQIKVTGAGNYTDDYLATTAMTYNIGKATLLVTPKATKVYDGTADLPVLALTDFTIQGFQKAETSTVITLTAEGCATRTGADKTKATPGVYDLEANLEKFAADNYKFAKQLGTFTITGKPATVTVANKLNVPYGTADDAIEYTISVDGELSAADETSIINATTVTKAATADADGHYALTLSKNEGAAAADLAVVDNYAITYGTGAYMTFASGELTIAIDESKVTLTKVYDGVVPTAPTLTLDNVIIAGLAAGDSKDQVTLPTAEIVSASKNVGTYQVKLSGGSYPGGKYNINLVNSQYKITAKPLTANISDQTLATGSTITTTLFTVDGIVEADGVYSDIFSLVLDPNAQGATPTTVKAGTTTGNHIILAVKPGKETVVTNYTGYAGILTDETAAEYNATLTGAVKEGDAVPADFATKTGGDAAGTTLTAAEAISYNATLTGHLAAGAVNPNACGKLIVTADKILDTNAEIVTTASAGAVNVTFSSDRVLNPQNWNAMVLPFEVTVAKLSQAFGYAVVNRLNTTATTADAVKFSLEMEKIPANEPFLIKVVGKLNGTAYEAVALNGVTIPEVNVVATTAAEISAGGNTFKGVYKAQELLGSTYGFLYDDPAGVRENKWYTPRNNAYTVQPLDAFLTYATAKAPVITVEDFDGTVTAIQTVNAGEFRQVESEGWYTLGGLKLQGAPTQKGVYINNGKKVVIK